MAATIYEREIPTAKEHDNRAKLLILDCSFAVSLAVDE